MTMCIFSQIGSHLFIFPWEALLFSPIFCPLLTGLFVFILLKASLLLDKCVTNLLSQVWSLPFIFFMSFREVLHFNAQFFHLLPWFMFFVCILGKCLCSLWGHSGFPCCPHVDILQVWSASTSAYSTRLRLPHTNMELFQISCRTPCLIHWIPLAPLGKSLGLFLDSVSIPLSTLNHVKLHCLDLPLL